MIRALVAVHATACVHRPLQGASARSLWLPQGRVCGYGCALADHDFHGVLPLQVLGGRRCNQSLLHGCRGRADTRDFPIRSRKSEGDAEGSLALALLQRGMACTVLSASAVSLFAASHSLCCLTTARSAAHSGSACRFSMPTSARNSGMCSSISKRLSPSGKERSSRICAANRSTPMTVECSTVSVCSKCPRTWHQWLCCATQARPCLKPRPQLGEAKCH